MQLIKLLKKTNHQLKNKFIFVLIFSILLGLLGCDTNNSLVKSGKPLPNFLLHSLNKERFYLNDYKKKVVVLVFWSTWCSYCKGEMIELNKYRKKSEYKDKVEIALICIDPENYNEMESIIKNLKLSTTILLDKHGKLFKSLKLHALPTTIIVDQDGIVRLLRKGYNKTILKHIKNKINNLLK